MAPSRRKNAAQRRNAADGHLVLVRDRARDHDVVLVLGEQRDRNETEATVDGDEDRRLFAAPDQRAIGNLPGAFAGGKKADARCGGLSGTQLARVGHFRAHQNGLGRSVRRLRDQHDLARRRVAVDLHFRTRSDGADAGRRNRDLGP